jgi:phosphatidylglycerophosphate synthase
VKPLQMPMTEALFLLAFMGAIVTLAAFILLVVDRFTLRGGLSMEERQSRLEMRSRRWHRRYLFFTFVIAVTALFVHAFNLADLPMALRLSLFLAAALFVLWYITTNKENTDHSG